MRARRQRGRHAPRVDLTPLLDTVFLVIVMLMCSFIHMRVVSSIKIERPVVATGTGALGIQNVLTVSICRDGQILFDGDEVSLDALAEGLAQRGAGTEACLISADRMARHGRVAEVVVAAKEALRDTPIYFEVERKAPPAPAPQGS